MRVDLTHCAACRDVVVATATVAARFEGDAVLLRARAAYAAVDDALYEQARAAHARLGFVPRPVAACIDAAISGRAEVWHAVVGYEGRYEVSDWGRVRSARYCRPVRQATDRYGYVTVVLWREYRRETRRVHSLVLEAFVGPRPFGYDGCHANGDRTDARLENLRYDDRTGNMRDQYRRGSRVRGEHVWRAKLGPATVLAVRARAAAGARYAALAAAYGVSKDTIGRVVRREAWRHVCDAHAPG